MPWPRVLRKVSQAVMWLPPTEALRAAAPPAGHLSRLQRHTPPAQPTASACPALGRHASAATYAHVMAFYDLFGQTEHPQTQVKSPKFQYDLLRPGLCSSSIAYTLLVQCMHVASSGREHACRCSSWCRVSLAARGWALPPPPLPLMDAAAGALQMCTRSAEIGCRQLACLRVPCQGQLPSKGLGRPETPARLHPAQQMLKADRGLVHHRGWFPQALACTLTRGALTGRQLPRRPFASMRLAALARSVHWMQWQMHDGPHLRPTR